MTTEEFQSLFIVRHGDRWDYCHPEWKKTAARPGDPPLSTLGHQQARETGVFLDSLLASEGYAKAATPASTSATANATVDGDEDGTMAAITWLSSPFLRTIQTSDDMLNTFTKVDVGSVQINPEYSIFELDTHGGILHRDLPNMAERRMYFPRVNAGWDPLFIPELPEGRQGFLPRCDRAMTKFHQRFPYRPRTAIVMVTHAAACIGLARAAANVSLQEINPAGPCSITRLRRTSDVEVWTLDPHDADGAFNGYVSHLSDVGTTTIPWNHFGDKSINNGYTGPPPPSSSSSGEKHSEL